MAGVGKGTVFHRFGNRMGLMTALMIERAQALTEAVTSGPPPLGPGAPDRDRLLAFLDAVIEVVSRNKSLLTELAFSAVTEPGAGAVNEAGAKHDDHPVYRFWHGHITALIAAQRPGADAEMIAHVLLGALHSEPVLAHLAAKGPGRPAAAVRALACAVLDAVPLQEGRLPGAGRRRGRAQARCQRQRDRDRGRRHDRHRGGRGGPLGRRPGQRRADALHGEHARRLQPEGVPAELAGRQRHEPLLQQQARRVADRGHAGDGRRDRQRRAGDEGQVGNAQQQPQPGAEPLAPPGGTNRPARVSPASMPSAAHAYIRPACRGE